MDKRIVLFILLSLLILLSWSAFVTKPYSVENKGVTQKEVTLSPSLSPVTPSTIPSVGQQAEEQKETLFNFKQNDFEVVFDENRGTIKEVVFSAYRSYKFPLTYGFLFGDNSMLFKKEAVTPESVTFVYADPTKKIVKDFSFFNSKYDIGLSIKIKNLTSAPLNINLPLFLGLIDLSKNQEESRFIDLTVATAEKTLHPNSQKDALFSGLKFLSFRDRYFCAILGPDKIDNFNGFVKKIKPQVSEIGIQSPELIIAPNQEIEQKFSIYLGPQELKLINEAHPEWSSVIYYGTFDFIAQVLLQMLGFLYNLVHNWGTAIIVLSILIYLILFPLSLKQMRSMKQMQMLQPHVEALKKTYKDNPQKLNKEIMALYSQHKVNPLGGCLPLLLQMPIFFALYQVLMRSVVLKGASFLWIKDLSEPDRLFIMPVSLPVMGNEINILPVVMAIGMFVQQKISTFGSGGTSASQQKIMLIMMPIIFGLIFYRMPSGLVLYWLINSILMLAYQIRLNQTK
ncbi:MAG: membrane protein insertase YidC [Candidatus Omnitrophica bacterium]|nr:membrane protein insertase YidC [Candidatus Omnitrophota bacterium]